MKLILSIALATLATVAAHATPAGRKLTLLPDQDGSPRLSVQYATAAAKVFSVSLSLQGSELVGSRPGKVAPSKWALVDQATGAQLTPWADTELGEGYVLPDSTQALLFALNDAPAIDRAIVALRHLALAISLRETQTVYVDLQELCQSQPEKFLSLDDFTTGCR